MGARQQTEGLHTHYHCPVVRYSWMDRVGAGEAAHGFADRFRRGETQVHFVEAATARCRIELRHERAQNQITEARQDKAPVPAALQAHEILFRD